MIFVNGFDITLILIILTVLAVLAWVYFDTRNWKLAMFYLLSMLAFVILPSILGNWSYLLTVPPLVVVLVKWINQTPDRKKQSKANKKS